MVGIMLPLPHWPFSRKREDGLFPAGLNMKKRFRRPGKAPALRKHVFVIQSNDMIFL